MESKTELKKHTAAIHCANSLSLLQRKISNALLYHAYHELHTHLEHEITVKQLCQTIGYSGHNHAAIKDALRGLITTLVEWNVVETDNELQDWTASTVLASVRIRGPLCYYAYSPRMKELLYSPSMYGKINLIIQSKFQSSYGLALYENCVRYRELNHTKWFEMESFRKLMGVPPTKYVIFRDLKKRVIEKSVQEVNQHSDLKITYEIQKKGRQVSKIRFLIENAAKRTKIGVRVGEGTLEKDSHLITVLKKEFGLSNITVNMLVKKYSTLLLQDKIKEFKESSNLKNIVNPGGYLITMLTDDNKSFDATLAKNNQEVESEEKKWACELKRLEGDLQHFERLLRQAQEGQRPDLAVNITDILIKCRRRISDHLQTKPMTSES